MGGVISRAGDGLSRGYASEGMRPDGGDRSAGGERGPRDGRSGEPGLGAASGEAPPGIAVPPSTVRTPDPLVPEIGRLHAEILRLRVLFKRLAAVAELDDGEFDLELEPFDLPSVRDAAEGLDLSIRALDPISDLSARMAHIFDERRSAHDRRVGGRVAPGTVRTSGFGHRPNPFGGGRRELHRGVDFAGPAGTPIHALADGIVTWSGWNGGYGNLVELDHGDGMRTALRARREHARRARQPRRQGAGHRPARLDRALERCARARRGARERAHRSTRRASSAERSCRAPDAPTGGRRGSRPVTEGFSAIITGPPVPGACRAPGTGRRTTRGAWPRDAGVHRLPEHGASGRPARPASRRSTAARAAIRVLSMLGNLVKKIVGSSNERTVKRLGREVDAINAFESTIASLDDAALAAKTAEFRERLDGGATLESLLPEAFAVVREAGKRALGMRHFDVQMIGGMVLHNGKIAEMRTGEGKTLVATTAVYLNALPGRGVHVITVNDYLARRDAEWMAKLYEFLGLSVGVIVNGLSSDQRREAYGCDVTYGTNNEFGFDYLRDNMAHSPEQKVQRGLEFAIVDEVDSILIDEARTPLIISGPADGDSELYHKLNAVVPRLTRQLEEEGEGDFSVDEKSKQVHLTEDGMERVEELLVEDGIMEEGESLYDPSRIAVLHHLNAALRAHAIYTKDKEYIVASDQIVIVDEFTGRTMPGRRWSEGLHQAIEAKEGVTIQRENQTLASITFQNFFRLYDKLAGMTGTADTEAYEFQQIYGLEVVVIPTHRPMVRDDRADLVFLTQTEKYDAIIEDIEDCAERRQPVLVGTTSVETSEYLSGLLDKKGIAHEVLNAKQHEREASIIENAGRPGAVTIATNMAGRGTDIVLGGSLEAELAAMQTAAGDPGADDAAKETARAAREEALGGARNDWDRRHEEVLQAGGLHIIGHRAARVAPHRQPAARPLGPPGRSGLDALLPLARGQPDAHLRQRARRQPDAEARHAGGRGDRAPLGHQGDRERAAKGRGSQLRHAQEPPRVRRRRE